MIILAKFGASAWNIIIVLMLTRAPIIFRIVRGLTLELREREYVSAAKMRGESPLYIMVVEILPNARGPLLVDMCLRIGYNTILIGVLGFLGIGLPPPGSGLGRHGQGHVRHDLGVAPHGALPVRGDLLAGRRASTCSPSGSGRPDCVTDPAPGAPALLEFQNVRISYNLRAGELNVVPGLSFTLGRGEALGLVGESGCGKSTVALAIMRYLGPAGRIRGGRILFEGRDLATLGDADLCRIRGRRIAMIYQDPMASLNPVMTVGRQLMEVPITHEGVGAGRGAPRARCGCSPR